MTVEEKICKITWMNLCGGMNVCLLCKTTFSFTKFTKANVTNVTVCEMFHFFLWILPTGNFRNVSLKYAELQRFPVFTAALSRFYVTIIINIIVIIIILFVFSSPFRCYLQMLQNIEIILLHWNIAFAHRNIHYGIFWVTLFVEHELQVPK